MRKAVSLKLFIVFFALVLGAFLSSCGGGGGGGDNTSQSEQPNNTVVSVAVARNDNGQAVVAYLRQLPGSRVYVNYFNGQNWLGPSQISGLSASRPKVAISDNGNAIVAWAENGYIWAKIYKNGWTQNYQIAGPYSGIDEEDFSVAMYPNGNAILVWSTGTRIVKREYNSANNTWSNPVPIYVSPTQLDSVSSPLVAIDKGAQPNPIADFVWVHNRAPNPQNPNDPAYQEVLFLMNGQQPIVVWKKDHNFIQPPVVTYYLKPTSFIIACDIIIGIHYTKVEYPVPPNTTYTITTQAYVSINPDGVNQPQAISNPRAATANAFDPNNIPAPWVGRPMVAMDNQCNAMGVWQEREGSGQWQDHVWFNLYKNSWQVPRRITTIDTSDYLASYDPVVDFLTNGKALLVYARNSQSGSPGYFATIADFTQSPISFSAPQRISRDPTLVLTRPGVSKSLAVWADSKTTNSQYPMTVYGRFYNNNVWSSIVQIGD